MALEQAIVEVIARLESAMGPNRELDRLIEEQLPGVLRHPYASSIQDGYVISGDGHPLYSPGQGYLPPRYTASIDAALTLAPADANCHGYEAEPKRVEAYFSRNNVSSGHWLVCGEHQNSPAIALCIAAMKARAIVAPIPK